MRYGDGKVKGCRLANPRDPTVRRALGRTCPECKAQPDQWCVGVAEHVKTKGKRRSRLHFARCDFEDADAVTGRER